MNYIECDLAENEANYRMPYFHRHSVWELHFLLAGNKTFHAGTGSYALAPGSVVIIKPNVFHHFEGGPAKRYLLSFDESVLSLFQNRYLLFLSDRIFVFRAEHFAELVEVLEEIKRLQESANANLPEMSLLTARVVRLIGSLPAKTGHEIQTVSDPDNLNAPVIPPYVHSVIKYIETHYTQDFSVDDLCKIANVSKTWLNRQFRLALKTTVIRYRNALRINYAKTLLKSTQLDLSTISANCGFSDQSYFCKIFQEAVGCTPLQYRKHHRAAPQDVR